MHSNHKITWLFAGLALVGFAANSVLCRLALAQHSIDAVSFTVIRLASGALLLWLLVRKKGKSKPIRENILPALMLFLYAVLFSWAYLQLSTATGALILFGSVQIGLLLMTILQRQRQTVWEWLALVVANAGFVWLMLPETTRPPLLAAGLMAGAGLAWAVYTWVGRASKKPIQDTADNFIHSLPFVGLLLVGFWLVGFDWHMQWPGLILAISSGALASALGYVCWYTALPGLSASQAGMVQLMGPVLAAVGGIFLVGEAVPLQVWLAAALILGGIGISLVGKARQIKK